MSASRSSLVYLSRRNPLTAACVATLFGLSASSAVHAAGTAVVTNCGTSAATIGSLPWAATQAINSGDTIDLTGISDFTSCAHNVDGFTESIVLPSVVTIATGVTIKGPNTSNTKALAVSTAATDRVFYSAGAITIRNLGIKYGKTSAINGSLGNTVYGGCVFARGGLTLNTVVMDKCSATSAVAGRLVKGGAVATFNGPITLTNSSITHSDATSSTSGGAAGGAIYAFGDVTLNNSDVSYNNVVAKSGYARGGSIAVRGAGPFTVTLTNSSVKYGYADSYGGFNAAGGGIYSSGDVTFSNGALSDTKAVQHNLSNGRAVGGGIFAKGDVSLSAGSIMGLTSATTSSNDDALGGAIYGGGGVTLTSSSIYFSAAGSTGGTAAGGGIYSVGGTIGLESNLFNNYASVSSNLSEGGAIFSKGGVEFKYGTIANNKAQEAGGIGVLNGDLYLRGATISNNYAKSAVSGVAMFTGGTTSTAQIINSTISGNTVASGGKYAVFVNSYTTKFFNSTIAYNTGGVATGTVLNGVAGSKAGLYSSLFSSNSLSNGTQNDFSKSTNVTFTASSSKNLIRNPASIVPTGTLTGVNACPFLHKLANNGGPTKTHRLGGGVSASAGLKNPAIDKGSNPDSLGSDQRGGAVAATTPARVSGSAADIGAYEVQQDDIIFGGEFEGCPN